MKRALVLLHHGLGDIIQSTPHLRKLHSMGYLVDLMCRKEVKTSKLLDNCPYIDKLIDVPNPWRAKNFQEQVIETSTNFILRGSKYDWMGCSLHLSQQPNEHKIDMTSRELGLKLEDKRPEVFIGDDEQIRDYIRTEFPDGYIVAHTSIEFHREHTWDAGAWIEQNLPKLPTVDTGEGGVFHRRWEDINKAFALLKYATHRVLSSSVMVHACDAMNLPVDVINYGKKDRKVWPINDIAIRIRECGEWVK